MQKSKNNITILYINLTEDRQKRSKAADHKKEASYLLGNDTNLRYYDPLNEMTLRQLMPLFRFL